MRKLNVTDRQTDRRTDGGRCNISRPGPSAPREIIKNSVLRRNMVEHNLSDEFGHLKHRGGGGGLKRLQRQTIISKDKGLIHGTPWTNHII